MKVREYKNFEEFEMDENRQDYELVAIVGKSNGGVCADLMTDCKRWQTAVDRFFRALEGDDRFAGWKDCIVEAIENGCWKQRETYWNPEKLREEYQGGWFWEVEPCGDSSFYVVLNPGLPCNA